MLLLFPQLLWLVCGISAIAFIDFTEDPPNQNLEIDDFADRYLGKDPDSGCICREKPAKMVLCFGTIVCIKFPRSVHVPTAMLRVKTTNIRAIVDGDLSHMSHLLYLEIEANHNLRTIQPGTFANMTNLRYLSLSYNGKITYLKETTFTGLINLTDLKMIKNGFLRINHVTPALNPVFLPKLQRFDLSENYLSNITQHDFKPLKGTLLIELNLILCQLDYFHPNSLLYLTSLTELRIGENMLNSSTVTNLLYQCINHNISIKTINLFGMGFRKAPPMNILKVISHSTVTQLVLAKNQFEFLLENSFPEMPQLKFLDLRQVLAVGVHENAFGTSNFPRLTTLLLGGNKLSKIPRGAMLPQLKSLDLSANAGTDARLSYFEIQAQVFQNMSNLLTLNLSYNKIVSLLNTTFIGLSRLKVLSLKNSTLFHIGEETFKPLRSLEFLNLEDNIFPINQNLSTMQFEGLENLQVLLLGKCSIRSFETTPDFFTVFPNLTSLSLRQNDLTVLSREYFKPLTKLRAIDLSGNKLSAWKEPLFTTYNKRLDKLILVDNKVTHLTDGMLMDFNLVLNSSSNATELQISGNPYTCDCSFHKVEDFINEHNFSVLDLFLANSLAVCATPDDWSDKTLAEYWSTFSTGARCSPLEKLLSNVNSAKLIFVVPIVLLLMTLLVLVFAFNYRWYIKNWLFFKQIVLTRRRKSLQSSNTQAKEVKLAYKYDAFVSYSSDDAEFVKNLVSVLESGDSNLKLCVYERDFEIGAIISEAVLESISLSRHVLLIVSDSFAKSQWCRWETQMAEHYKIFFEAPVKRNPLILIKYGNVSQEHLTPTLNYLLKTRIHLQWTGDSEKAEKFWSKLKRTLQKS